MQDQNSTQNSQASQTNPAPILDDGHRALASLGSLALGLGQSYSDLRQEYAPQVNQQMALNAQRQWIDQYHKDLNQTFALNPSNAGKDLAGLSIMILDDTERTPAEKAALSRRWLAAAGTADHTGRVYFGEAGGDEQNFERIRATLDPDSFESPLPTAYQSFLAMSEEEQNEALKKRFTGFEHDASRDTNNPLQGGIPYTLNVPDEFTPEQREQFERELQSRDHRVQMKALTQMMGPEAIAFATANLEHGVWDEDMFGAFERHEQRAITQYLQANREHINPSYFTQELPSRLGASTGQFFSDAGGFAVDVGDAYEIGWRQFMEDIGLPVSDQSAAEYYDEREDEKADRSLSKAALRPQYESSGFAGDTLAGAIESIPFTASLLVAPKVGIPVAIASMAKQGRDEAVYMHGADPDRAYLAAGVAATASVLSERLVAKRVFDGQKTAVQAFRNRQIGDAFRKALTSVVKGTGENSIQEAFQSWIEITGQQFAIDGMEGFDPVGAAAEVYDMLPHLVGVSFWMTVGIGGAGGAAEYLRGDRAAQPQLTGQQMINNARVIEHGYKQDRDEFLAKEDRDEDWFKKFAIDYISLKGEPEAQKAFLADSGVKDAKQAEKLIQQFGEIQAEMANLEQADIAAEESRFAEEERQDAEGMGEAAIRSSDVTFKVRKIQERFEASGAAAPLRLVDTVDQLDKSVVKKAGDSVIEGYYDANAGEVVLVAENLRSADHALEVWAEEQVGHFANREGGLGDFTAIIEGSGVTIDQMRESLGAGYESLDSTGVVDEYVAKIARKVVDKDTLDVQEQTIWQRIKDWFAQTFGLDTAGPQEAMDRAIAELIKARTRANLSGELVRDPYQLDDQVEQSGELLRNTEQLDSQAEQSGNSGELGNVLNADRGEPADIIDSQSGQTLLFSLRSLAEQRERFEQNRDAELLIVDSVDNPPKSKKAAKAWWRKNKFESAVNLSSKVRALVSGNTIEKATSGGKGYARVRMASVPTIKELYENAFDTVYRPNNKEHDDNTENIIELDSAFRYEGELYRVRLTVKRYFTESKQPDRLHSLRIDDVVVEKVDGAQLQNPTKQDEDPTRAHSPSTNKITLGKLFNDVNPFDNMKESDFRFSLAQTPDEQAEIDSEMAEIERLAKASGTWLKAPNGEDSNLNPHQWKQVRTTRFKAWFGDWEADPENASKVVDENGEPMVVYHGTPDGSFTEFSKDKIGLVNAPYSFGFYFTSDPSEASLYAKDDAVVMPGFVSITNPLVEKAGSGHFPSMVADLERGRIISSVVQSRKLAREYDGVLIDNSEQVLAIALQPNQIKSATGNTGQFSEQTNDIRFALRQEQTPERNAAIVASREILNGFDVTVEDIQRLGDFDEAQAQFILKNASQIAQKTAQEVADLADVPKVNARLRYNERALFRSAVKRSFRSGERRGQLFERAQRNLRDRRRADNAARIAARPAMDIEDLLKWDEASDLLILPASKVKSKKKDADPEKEQNKPLSETAKSEIAMGKYKDGDPKPQQDIDAYLLSLKNEIHARLIQEGVVSAKSSLSAAMDTPQFKEDFRKNTAQILNLKIDRIEHSKTRTAVEKLAREILDTTRLSAAENKFKLGLSLSNQKRITQDRKTLQKRLRDALKYVKKPAAGSEAKDPRIAKAMLYKLHYAKWVSSSQRTFDQLDDERLKLRLMLQKEGQREDLAKVEGEDGDLNKVFDFYENQAHEAADKMQILNMFEGLQKADAKPADLAKAIRWAEELTAEGVAKQIAFNEKRDAENNAFADDFEEGIRAGNKRIKYKPKAAPVTRIAQSLLFLNQKFQDVVRYAKGESGKKIRKKMDDLSEDINQAVEEVEKATYRDIEEFREAVERIYTDSESEGTLVDKSKNAIKMRKAISDLTAPRKDFAKFSGEGKDAREPLSRSFLIQVIAMLEQKGYADMAIKSPVLDKDGNVKRDKDGEIEYQTHNEDLAWFKSKEAEIREVLTTQDLKLLGWFRDYYYRKGLEMNPVVETTTGLPMRSGELFYMPGSFIVATGGTKQVFKGVDYIPGFTESRVRHNRKMDRRAGVVELFMRRVEEQNRFLYMGELNIELRGKLTKQRTQDVMESTYGEVYKNQFYQHLSEVMMDDFFDGAVDDGTAIVNQARAFMAVSRMGGSLISGSKQVMGFLSLPLEIHSAAGVVKPLQVISTPQGWADMKLVLQSENMKARMGKGFNEVVMNALAVANTPGMFAFKEFARIMMKVPQGGDAIASAIVGASLYRTAVNSFAAKGYGEPASERKAMNLVFGVISRTQQSAHIKDRAGFIRTKNPFAKSAAQFLSAPAQHAAYQAQAIREVYARPSDKEARRKLIGVLVSNHVFNPIGQFMMKEIFQALFDDEDEGIDWEQLGLMMLGGPASGLLFAGFVVEAILGAAITGKPDPFLGGTTLDGPLEDAEAMTLLIRSIALGEDEDVFASINDFLQSVFPAWKQANVIFTDED